MAIATPPESVERSVEDVLAGRLRIRLAGTWYFLPVLTIGQNEEWLASLDAELAPLMAEENDLDKVVRLLDAFNDRLLEFVWSYDRAGVLPPLDSIRKDIYPHEALRAVMEVRLAANPTLGFALAGAVADIRREQLTTTTTASSERTSSPRRRTASRSKKSDA